MFTQEKPSVSAQIPQLPSKIQDSGIKPKIQGLGYFGDSLQKT